MSANRDWNRIPIGKGEMCPKCSVYMSRFKHSPDWKARPNKAWFKYWDICKICRHTQNYQEAKVAAEVPKIEKKKKQPKYQKSKHLSEFYRSWEWKRLRYKVLLNRGRKCECCGARFEDGAVIVVDHIKPIRHFWDLRLDVQNLQVLCRDCNMGKGSRYETNFSQLLAVQVPPNQ